MIWGDIPDLRHVKGHENEDRGKTPPHEHFCVAPRIIHVLLVLHCFRCFTRIPDSLVKQAYNVEQRDIPAVWEQ